MSCPIDLPDLEGGIWTKTGVADGLGGDTFDAQQPRTRSYTASFTSD